MRGAPIGTEVGLYYDGWVVAEEGDVIQTPTGRTYRVVSNRIQQRGKRVGRQHLRVQVISAEDVTDDDTVHPLHWYPRNRRASGL